MFSALVRESMWKMMLCVTSKKCQVNTLWLKYGRKKMLSSLTTLSIKGRFTNDVYSCVMKVRVNRRVQGRRFDSIWCKDKSGLGRVLFFGGPGAFDSRFFWVVCCRLHFISNDHQSAAITAIWIQMSISVMCGVGSGWTHTQNFSYVKISRVKTARKENDSK